MTNNKLQKIAVIGTGIMGMPVASNLAKSGDLAVLAGDCVIAKKEVPIADPV